MTTVGDSRQPVFELAPGESLAWDKCELHALFAPEFELRPVLAALRDAATPRQSPSFDINFIGDEDWSNAWRQHAADRIFGNRLRVAPRDAAVADSPNMAVVRLDPGLAFGTGTHPTTRLCLEGLAQADLVGRRVIDYGCGSGILAIAAAKLGAARVLAIDHDPQALLATRENAAYNSVAETVQTGEPAFVQASFRADLVVANILANPLVELAPTLMGHAAGGGSLVLSGLLADQAASVRSAYPGVAFAVTELAGWIALTGRAP